MYVPCLCNEYIKGVGAFIDFTKKDMLDNIRGNLCYPCKHCKNEKRYLTNDVLMSHLIKHGFMEDYRCWNKHGKEGINEAEMRDSYLEREVHTSVKEDHDDLNKTDILGFTDDDIEFQVHNIEDMVHNVERYGDDDQYSNGKLGKCNKMIEDYKKPLYHGCAEQYI
jgi:glutaredoxin